MSENNNIDNLFRKAFKDRSCEPPPHIWNRIEHQLDVRKRKRQTAVWWLSGAAAIALLLSVTWLFEVRQTDPVKQVYATLETTPPSVDHSSNAFESSDNIPSNGSKRITESATLASLSPVESINPAGEEIIIEEKVPDETSAPIEVRPISGNTAISNNGRYANLRTNRANRDIIPLTSGASIENNRAYNKLLNRSQPEYLTSALKEDNEKIKVSLSGHIAPVYSSGNYNSSVKNPKGYSYSNDLMSGIVNVSGGLKVSVATNKRLSVQAGLFYTKMGQRTKEDNSYVAHATARPSATGSETYMTTPFGNIKNKSKLNIYKAEGAPADGRSASESIEQLFGAIEIPLSVKYRLNNNKVQFSVLGGVSSSFIVDNQVYLKYSDSREKLGSTEDIRTFNISTDLGFGVEYPITSKIKVMLEPGFKYYLQSLSQNKNIDFKPYTFTFSTGIGIDF